MKNIITGVLLGSLGLLLGGCSTLSGVGKDNQPHPTPLQPIVASVQVKPIWSARPGNGAGKAQLGLPLAAEQGVVYISNENGVVAAYDVDSGKKLWLTRTRAQLTSGPGVGADLVAVGTSIGELIVLDKHSGQLRWRKTLATQILATPQIKEDKIIVKTIDGQLYALSVLDGSLLWQYEHPSSQYMLLASGTPQVTKNKLIAGFNDGKLIAVELANGQLLWERAIATPQGVSLVQQLVDVATSPLVVDNTIYIATYQGRLLAMSLDGTQLLWERNFSTYNNLAFANQRILAVDTDSQIWAINAQTNKVAWRQPELMARHLTAPVLYNQAIVVGDVEGYLHWLSTVDGHFLARVKVSKDSIITAPIVVNNKLVVITKAGAIAAYAYNL